MALGNLPFPKTFKKRPLVWGAPPTSDDAGDGSVITPPPLGQQYLGEGAKLGPEGSISSAAFTYNNLLGTLSSVFPVATLVLSQAFTLPVGIVGITLSTSLKNATTDGVIAVVVARANGATIDFSKNTDLYVEHLVTAGLTHSMRSGSVYADDVALKIASGEKVGLYVSSAGTGSGSNLISAIVNIRYFALTQ